jgi:hypothetical protein
MAVQGERTNASGAIVVVGECVVDCGSEDYHAE